MVSEQQSGYISAFSIYTGSECNELVQRNATMDPSCPITTKTVMGLFDSRNLLDMHRQVCFDNWFNSVELLLEMLAKDTYGAGTVKTNRKDLPKVVGGKHVKLKKKGETVYRWNGHLLCLQWCDRRPVTMLSTICEQLKLLLKESTMEKYFLSPPLSTVTTIA